jgi:hypothetical protein
VLSGNKVNLLGFLEIFQNYKLNLLVYNSHNILLNFLYKELNFNFITILISPPIILILLRINIIAKF